MLLFLVWLIYELILLAVIKLIRISVDPNNQFLKGYSRFKILKEYKIGYFLIAYVPTFLFFLFWLIFFILVLILSIPLLNRIIVCFISFFICLGLFSYLQKNFFVPKKLFSKIILITFSISDFKSIEDIFQEFSDIWGSIKGFFLYYLSKFVRIVK
ncbi:MAG: hypothetical protein ABFD63_14220, partial [Smithella sp.]